MIGKQDWYEMADQIHELENRMRSTYAQLAKQISDPELKEIFERMSADEGRHAEAILSISDKIVHS